MALYGKVTEHPTTIPLNFGGDPDSQSGLRILNINVLTVSLHDNYCNGQGLRGHLQQTHNNVLIQRFIRIPLNPEERLLMCGINTSKGLYTYVTQSPNSLHMDNAS